MTFCFAFRCQDGVVVAGDRRVMEGVDIISHGEQTKVEAISRHNVVCFAGEQFLDRYLLRK